MKAWTDYPFTELGDIAYQQAPIREVKVIDYDGDKYCTVIVEDRKLDVKAGYLYKSPGRLGEVENIAIDAIDFEYRIDFKQDDHELSRITIDGTPIGPPLRRQELKLIQPWLEALLIDGTPIRPSLRRQELKLIQSWLETSLKELSAILAENR